MTEPLIKTELVDPRLKRDIIIRRGQGERAGNGRN